tara:strand:+ start:2236 stop:2751 length:516 start_codon:yes stop_codon:yes gene_type:complete
MAKDLKSKLIEIIDFEHSKFQEKLAFSIEKTITSNFKKSRDVNGGNFAALKKSTERDRRRNNFPPKRPILFRSGGLLNSIKVASDKSTKNINIFSTGKHGLYAEDLNDGNHSGSWGKNRVTSKMPARSFLDVPSTLEQGGAKREELFSEFYNNVISKFGELVGVTVDDLLK